MSFYFTADQHFDHDAIIEYCNRPFENVNDMNKTLINKWNNKVDNNDYVFLLGDIALTSSTRLKELINKLNGKIILIKGNHDSKSSSQYINRYGLYDVYDNFLIINRDYILTHEPVSKQIRKEYERITYDLNGHFEYRCRINLHGHVHNSDYRYEDSNEHICISVDRTNFEPIRLSDLGFGNPNTVSYRGVTKTTIS